MVLLGVTTENTEYTEFHGKKHGIPLRLRNNTERIRKRETPVEMFSGFFCFGFAWSNHGKHRLHGIPRKKTQNT
ncbi:MAG: hypothetical protein O0V67_06675, partial [Methanocorpusculum sp.]|nr:hypothetical protein [Methanocorpusculum sp.]